MDVKELYPSIPRKEGLDACREALIVRGDQSMPTEEVLKLIELVLDNNNFQFEDSHYLQIDGTAIGSKLGKNYACTYMATWEKQLLDTELTPVEYVRFVDDIWGIWTHGEEALIQFHKRANSIHTRIEVDLRYSTESIEFLDTVTSIKDGYIKTNLYCKPTDTHQYLHRTSHHPKTVKKSIPYGVGIRMKRICSDENDYQNHAEKLTGYLTHRGYRGYDVKKQLHKVENLDREELLKYRNKSKQKKSKRVPLVVTYSKHLPNIGEIVRRRLPILHRSEKMKVVFKEPALTAYRRARNIADICVHMKHHRQFNRETPDASNARRSVRCVHICPKMIHFMDLMVRRTKWLGKSHAIPVT